ncbi:MULTISPECIES: class I SAM-dependent methyltransferase [unclassified Allobranchiibius]|uniref:class I SAM-dependent methyltransferase n=1 Tax=unclassified Allobranchiibius TaxID=2649857 RepID=UPI001AA15EB0|nr:MULTISPECIES: class I SAM-dependent methyltransferase [unclassified Allobranchiibius]MBO1765510.1 class I SAM-dependent methyltransferase [Allobranchiibius sp. GilTou38]UIJ35376.1 class I SAM-dependent methyltransferase [Allobranchiibius sp. GilTou73]
MDSERRPGRPAGRGSGTITSDGCPVEIYAALPPHGEADIVHAALPAGAAVLDLGCGPGRIANPLVALGHRVVAVDDSLGMLAYLQAAEPVHSTIETLQLPERFAGVVLAGVLINTFDPAQRSQFLRAAVRHMTPDATLVLQRHAPGWAEAVTPSVWNDGPVALELKDVVRHGDGLVSATLMHTLGELVEEQDFTARVLDDTQLASVLRDAGLVFDRVLTPDQRWVSAHLPR